MSVNSFLPPFPPSSSSFSSPPSSPNPFTDSSPASSPGFLGACEPDDDDVPELTLAHPLAASVKSSWRPPQYEKKRPLQLSFSPPPPEHKAKKHKHASFDPHPNFLPSSSPVSPIFPSTPAEIENDKWGNAVARVIDENHGLVDLNNEALTAIPLSFIEDLNKFYVPPEDDEILFNTSPHSGNRLARTATAPPGEFLAEPRTFSRTRSAANASFGVPRDRIQLHLSNNFIKRLPLAIFRLENLSVLALRNNQLTYIPPEINQFRHLHTLNVTNNKLQYLPSELLQMNLQHLFVNLNPFVSPPLSSTGLALTRPVSPQTYLLPKIPPFSELCLRMLLSPSPHDPQETILDAQYDLPLDEGPTESPVPLAATTKTRCNQVIPTEIKQVFYATCSWSVQNFQEEKDLTLDTGMGTCPSPHHQNEHRLGSGLFLRPAVERYTWERTIAGVTVGGLVPIKWRGCLRHCLDFLHPSDSSQPEPYVDDGPPSEEEDWSMDTDDVVQVVDLGASALDDEEGFDA